MTDRPRKYPGVFRKVRPRTSLIHPAGGCFRPVYVIRGNIRGFFGKYARGEAYSTLIRFRFCPFALFAEISGGFSESTPTEKPDTPGRGLFPSRLCHPRKYPGSSRKVRPRTSLIHPAGHYIGNRQRYIGAFYRTIILKLIREQGSWEQYENYNMSG